jgi:hypothetical protein
VSPAPLDVSSIPSVDSPQGLVRSELPLPCTARRPPPLSPGAAAAAAAATERSRPAPRARGEGAGIGGRHPLRGWRRIFSLIQLRLTVGAISLPAPSPSFPRSPTSMHPGGRYLEPVRKPSHLNGGELQFWPRAPKQT